MQKLIGPLALLGLGAIAGGCEPSEGGRLCEDINLEAPGCTIICPWRDATDCDAVAADDCLQRVQNATEAGATCGQVQTIVGDICTPGCR